MKGILKGGDPAEGTMIIECDGVQYEFNIFQAERHYSNGIALGNEITIKYTGKIVGTDTTKANVRVVIDTDDNATKEKEDVKIKVVIEYEGDIVGDDTSKVKLLHICEDAGK